MANFNQNVTINLSVESRGVQSKLGAVASEIKGVKESIEGVEGSFGDASESLNNFADAAQNVTDSEIAPSLNLSDIEEEMDSFNKFADSLEKVSELKDEVAESNEVLNQKNKDTGESTDAEAQSFESLMESAESLSDAKDAVTKSNEALDDQTSRTKREILDEKLNMEALGDTALDKEQLLDSLVGTQQDLEEQSNITTDAIGGENDATQKLAGGLDGLEGAKKAASEANRKLGGDAEETSTRLQEEFDITQKEADALAGLRRETNDTSDAHRSLTRSVTRMADEIDDSSQSMRAATEVGELFEDGLGSLSVNLGAFTIALRNFLTQVPLLLTALGGLGAAALSSAAAFSALAGSLGALVGVGALVHAQNLKEEFGQIEELGQSMEVIMRNVFDTFLLAIQPLTEMTNIVSFFTEAVEGTAGIINMLAQSIKELTQGSEQLQAFADSVGTDLFTIQDAIDSIDGDSLEELAGAIMEAWVLLGEEVTSSLGAVTRAIADAIERSSLLLAEVESVGDAMSQFSETISELAELGFTIGGGLLPVFESFSSIVEGVASSINEMDDQIIAGLVTFSALFVATDKVAGTMSSIVRVMPGIIGGFGKIASSARNAENGVYSLTTAMQGVAGRTGGFLESVGAFGGMGELAAAAGSTGEAFREVAFGTDEAAAKFTALAANTRMSGSDLQSLAAQGELTKEMIGGLASQTEELGDVMDSRVKAELLAEGFDPSALGDEADDMVENMQDFDTDEDMRIMPNMDNVSNFKQSLADTDDTLTDSARKLVGMGSSAEDASESMSLLKRVQDTYRSSNSKLIRGVGAVGEAFAATSNVVAKYINRLAGVALMTLKVVANKTLLAFTNYSLATSELTAATATEILKGALNSLTGGLFTVITGILALIVTLGTLAVGIAKNMESIKGNFGGAMSFIGGVIDAISDLLMTVFIATWEAVKMTIMPLLKPFKMLALAIGSVGDSSEGASSASKVLSEAFDLLLSVISGLIRTLGLVGKVVSSAIIFPFEVAALFIGAVIDGLQALGDLVATGITGLAQVVGLFQGQNAGDVGFFDLILMTLELINNSIEDVGVAVENTINSLIRDINSLIVRLNEVPGVNMAQISEVDLTREEAASTSQADVDAKRDNNITYNEDNSTNIQQTVDADPEDQAKLSRVVSDAINEANSFERRRQGGQ